MKALKNELVRTTAKIAPLYWGSSMAEHAVDNRATVVRFYFSVPFNQRQQHHQRHQSKCLGLGLMRCSVVVCTLGFEPSSFSSILSASANCHKTKNCGYRLSRKPSGCDSEVTGAIPVIHPNMRPILVGRGEACNPSVSVFDSRRMLHFSHGATERLCSLNDLIHACLFQSAEITDLNPVQCEFESRSRHHARVPQKQREQAQTLFSAGARPVVSTNMPYYSNAEGTVLETVKCRLDPDVGHQCKVGHGGQVISKITGKGSIPLLCANGFEEKQQIHSPVTREIAGAAPVDSAKSQIDERMDMVNI